VAVRLWVGVGLKAGSDHENWIENTFDQEEHRRKNVDETNGASFAWVESTQRLGLAHQSEAGRPQPNLHAIHLWMERHLSVDFWDEEVILENGQSEKVNHLRVVFRRCIDSGRSRTAER
jgi:hypothetical protein